jgi:hypothetical protein
MRVKLVHLFVCCALLMSFAEAKAQAGKAKQNAVFDDPIFGISYDPSVVKYEPVSLPRQCPPGGRFLRLFAHVKTEQSEYYIVMDTNPADSGDTFGAAVWVQGSKCRVADSNWVLSGVPPKEGYNNNGGVEERLPGIDAPVPKECNSGPDELCYYTLRSAGEEAILRSLVKDGFQRAIKAYGGYAPFSKKVCSHGTELHYSLYPVIQQELQKFCSNPGGPIK